MTTLLEELDSTVRTIGTDIKLLNDRMNGVQVYNHNLLGFVRSGLDSNGVYTVVSDYRDDNTLYKKSTMSGGTSPEYTTLTVDFYESDGITIAFTRVYNLTYSNGEIVSMLLQVD